MDWRNRAQTCINPNRLFCGGYIYKGFYRYGKSGLFFRKH